MAEFDEIMAGMGVQTPKNRKPSAEEMREIFAGARRMATPEVTQPVVEDLTPEVVQPTIEEPKESVFDRIEARKQRLIEDKELRAENSMSRDLERSGIQQPEVTGDSFMKRFGKNLVDNPFVEGLTALPRAVADAPNDIREAGEGIAERAEERGDILSDLAVKTDMTDTKQTQELAKETAGQLLGTAGDYVGAIFMTAMKLPFTQKTEDKIAGIMKDAGKGVADSPIHGTGGKTVADAVVEVGKAWDEYEARDPEGARSYRLAGNLGQFAIDVLTGGAGKKVVGKGVDVGIQEAKAGLKAGLEAGAEVVSKIEVPNLSKFKKMFEGVPKAEKPAVLKKAMKAGEVAENEAEAIAKALGIELSASATSIPLASKTEQILGQGLFGGAISKRANKSLAKFDDVVTGIEKSAPSAGELGENIANKFSQVEKAYRKTIDDLYASAEELADTKGVTMVFKKDSPTMKLLDDLIEQKGLAEEVGVPSPELPFLRNLRKGFDETQTVVQRRAVLREIGDKANFKSFAPSTEEKIWRKMYHSMRKDFDQSLGEVLPQMKAPLDKANKMFRGFEKVKARPFVQKIKKLTEKGDFDTISEMLTKTSVSANEIKIMYQTLGKDIERQLQKRFLANIIKKSRRAGGEGFTPSGFSKQLKSIGQEKLSAVFTPDQVKLLQNLDTLNAALAKSVSIGQGSQTAILQNINLLRGGVGVFSGGTSLVAEYILAKFFGGEMGQKLLKSLGKKKFDNLKTSLIKEKNAKPIKIVPKKKPKVTVKKPAQKIVKKANIDTLADKASKYDTLGDFVKALDEDKFLKAELKKLGIEYTTPRGLTAGLKQKFGKDMTIAKFFDDSKKTGSSGFPGSTGVSDKEVIKKVLTPNKKGTAIIDADNIKTILGSTPDNAPLYHAESSRLAQEAFAEGLPKVRGKFVDLTSGGSGSGKTEVLINGVNGINGSAELILDGTGANFKKLLRNVDQVIEAGKTPRLNMVYADKDQAWRFVEFRGRKVPREIFEEKHKDFRTSVLKAMEARDEIVPVISVNSIGTGMGGKRLKFKTRGEALDFMREMEKHGSLPTKNL